MNKFEVTRELATLIKTMRTQNKISSKNLAAHIGKSPSYISKLERGDIKMVQPEELTSIFEFIIPGDDFYGEKLPLIIRTATSFLTPEQMLNQIWLLRYDIQKRPIEIPEAMVDELKEYMRKLEVDVPQLTKWINENKDSAMSSAFPDNELVGYVFKEYRIPLVRVITDEGRLDALLTKKHLTAGYLEIHSTFFTLIRHDLYGEKDLISDWARDILNKTQGVLERYGVYSLMEYNHLLTIAPGVPPQKSLLSMFSDTSTENIEQIVQCFQQASEHDVLNTAQVLERFQRNLTWDPAFTLKLMEMSFYDLSNTSFSVKKKLLEDIAKVLDKYKKMPAYEKNIEIY